jgi:AraC-like DNA-binding protein
MSGTPCGAHPERTVANESRSTKTNMPNQSRTDFEPTRAGVSKEFGRTRSTKADFHGIRYWETMAKDACYRVALLAQACNVTPRRMEQYFRSQFASSPRAWLRKVRMEHAATMLKHGEQIKEVAFECCFKQVSHFSREFKRYHGKSPKTFIVHRQRVGD